MLGSFPPQRKRWSMDFYYPNLNNDMWRIVGLLFFGDKDHFLNDTRKAFCREQIIDFLNEFVFEGRAMRLYRMPSSSRAYPLALDKKAAAYRIMYQDLQMVI